MRFLLAIYLFAIFSLTAHAEDICAPTDQVAVCAAKKSADGMVVVGLGLKIDREILSKVIGDLNESGRSFELMFVEHNISRGVILFADLGVVGQIKIINNDYAEKIKKALSNAHDRFFP